MTSISTRSIFQSQSGIDAPIVFSTPQASGTPTHSQLTTTKSVLLPFEVGDFSGVS
jgi:hypothetical protein